MSICSSVQPKRFSHRLLQGRIEKQKVNEKYDDIFSSVVARVTTNNFDKLSSQYVPKPSQSYLFAPNAPSVVKAKETFICVCNELFDNHRELHEHLVFMHGDTSSPIRCSHCVKTQHCLSVEHFCEMCDSYVDDLEHHVRTHYLTKQGKDGLYECPRCCKWFGEMVDLRKHEQRVHSTRPAKVFPCEMCDEIFLKKYSRDDHFIHHFDSIVTMVMQNVESIKVADPTPGLPNCPLCRKDFSSRKSFKRHIFQTHIMMEQRCDLLRRLAGPDVNREALDKLTNYIKFGTIAGRSIKCETSDDDGYAGSDRSEEKEIKKEPDDDEFHNSKVVKTEPVDEGLGSSPSSSSTDGMGTTVVKEEPQEYEDQGW